MSIHSLTQHMMVAMLMVHLSLVGLVRKLVAAVRHQLISEESQALQSPVDIVH